MDNSVCFIGHRNIAKTDELIEKLNNTIENLITNENVCVFMFGSKSKFDDICYEVVTSLKEKYPHITRIYVRAEYPYIDDDYKNYLLQSYEDTYFPDKLIDAGKYVYVERNCEMIDKSTHCIVYYDKDYLPKRRRNSKRDLFDYQPKSGTALAYNYAVQKKKKIINLFDMLSENTEEKQ